MYKTITCRTEASRDDSVLRDCGVEAVVVRIHEAPDGSGRAAVWCDTHVGSFAVNVLDYGTEALYGSAKDHCRVKLSAFGNACAIAQRIVAHGIGFNRPTVELMDYPLDDDLNGAPEGPWDV